MEHILLAQNLLAKFCHDLSGNLTAIIGAADFLDDKNLETQGKARELIRSSIKQTIARLEFFRAAYGASKQDGEANLEEIRLLSAALLAGSKTTLGFHANYSHQPDVFICGSTGRLILCVIYIAHIVLLYGGTIKVDVEKTNTGSRIIITASGKKIKHDIKGNRILYGETKDLELLPSNVHYYYTSLMIKEIGGKITINLSDTIVQYIVES
jgi:histidine phosphotransferase ChpT